MLYLFVVLLNSVVHINHRLILLFTLLIRHYYDDKFKNSNEIRFSYYFLVVFECEVGTLLSHAYGEMLHCMGGVYQSRADVYGAMSI